MSDLFWTLVNFATMGSCIFMLGYSAGQHREYVRWHEKYDEVADKMRRYKFQVELNAASKET